MPIVLLVRWIFLALVCMFTGGVFTGGVAMGSEPKHVLMIAGPPSHGYGAHEHYAGLRLLASEIEADDCAAEVVKGWPTDASKIEHADSIVFFADGGGRHPAIEHLDVLERRAEEGCGLAAIHYATETVPGEVGDRWLGLMGGHFEINYSVNPHWTAELQPNPEHPISDGVKPFKLLDEWYFHLRFQPEGVTSILQAVAPESTMRRKDGHHSGNPDVRKSVAAKEPQILAWAYERPTLRDGGKSGRSFGITGGHFHWVWGNESMRTVTTRGIRWTAGLPVDRPQGQGQVTTEDLLENQDYDQPKDFDLSRIEEFVQSP